MTKNELRQHHLNLRKDMSPYDVRYKSNEIIKRLIVQKWVVNADVVFSYNAINNEVVLNDLIEMGQRVALPQVINDTQMVFRLVNARTQYKRSNYGVLEPIDGSVVEPTEASVVLMPGSCYDLKGNRIGYGGGYYDLYLNNNKCKGFLIGICYDHQLTETIPKETHDVMVSTIITETQLINL